MIQFAQKCYMISWRWGLVCDEQQSTDFLEIFLKINSYSMAINVGYIRYSDKRKTVQNIHTFVRSLLHYSSSKKYKD